jgi:hypothetical protein
MEYVISNDDEMTRQLEIFIQEILQSPKGNDPEIVDILNKMYQTRDVVELSSLTYKLIEKLQEIHYNITK